MKSGRSKKAFINTLAFATKEVVALLCNFILPRLILSYFGSTYNGAIHSITQFLNFITIFQFGIEGSTKMELYKSLANNDSDRTSSIVNGAQKYTRKTGLIAIVYAIVLVFVYPALFRENISFVDVAVLVVALSITTISQFMFGLTYISLLKANQKAHIIYIVQMVVNVLVTAISCLLIVVGLNLPIVKLISGIVWIVYPLFIFFYSRKKYKIDSKVAPATDLGKKRRDAMVHSFANLVHENVDVLALTIFMSAATVSVYSVYALVFFGLRKIFSVFTGTLEAPFGELFAKDKNKLIKTNLSTYEFMSCGFISIFYCCSSVLLLPFISLYTKNVHDIQYIVPVYAGILIVCEALFAFRVPYQTVVRAAGHYKQTKIHAIVEALLNLSISFALIPVLGLIGAVIGTFVANLYRAVIYSFYSYNKLIKDNPIKIIERLLFIIVVFVTAYAICNRIISFIEPTNWFKWTLCGFISFIISLLVFISLSLIMYKQDLSRLTSKILIVLPRHKRRQNE